MFPHMVEEKVCGSSGRDHSDSGNEMCTCCDGIDDNHDRIVACRLWQLPSLSSRLHYGCVVIIMAALWLCCRHCGCVVAAAIVVVVVVACF